MPVTYKLISTVTVSTATAASIEFTSIPGTFDDLQVVLSIRTNRSAVNDNIWLSFNGSASNFSGRWVFGDGSGTGDSTTGRIGGFANGNTATASIFGSSQFYIPNYTAAVNKSYSVDAALENNATLAYVGLAAGLWSQTAAITSITLSPDVGPAFLQHSSAQLYGIKRT